MWVEMWGWGGGVSLRRLKEERRSEMQVKGDDLKRISLRRRQIVSEEKAERRHSLQVRRQEWRSGGVR